MHLAIKPLTRIACLLALAAGGCASGTHYSQMQFPPIAQGQGRVMFYRESALGGSGVTTGIRLNGEVVGSSQAGGFFFVDRNPGDYEVSAKTEAEHKLTFALAASETRYVKTEVEWGIFIGQIKPELIDNSAALKEIQDCSYIGPPLTGQQK
jgi:hypothetical protein